ncbi:MAG: peptidylprolyl isomerase [Fibrobacter sp.]|nr:peptidylprolyl isomerase [Fibrobacter sp.]
MFKQTDAPQTGETIALMKTTKGEMKIRLFVEQVGEAAENFVELANQGHYNDVPFHRVIEGFVIQGGDFTARNGTGGHSYKGPGTKIGDVYHDGLSHIRGALSWAKTQAPNSIGSQFFVVHPEEGTHFLDHPQGGGPAEGYTVFGQVYEGFEALDAIATAPTGRGDAPTEEILIESVEISVLE